GGSIRHRQDITLRLALQSFDIRLGQAIMGPVAASNHGELLNHALADARSIYPSGAQVACEHLVVVPLAVGGRTVGVCSVARRSDPPFLARELDIVHAHRTLGTALRDAA
ncbi:MAG TPA: GAF domain-containing protein, partial [Chloroflexota bacterium]